jgi:hypothetical protein
MSTTATPPAAEVAIPRNINKRLLRYWDRLAETGSADADLMEQVDQCYLEKGDDLLIAGLNAYLAVADELVDPDPSVYLVPPARKPQPKLSRFYVWRESMFGLSQLATPAQLGIGLAG